MKEPAAGAASILRELAHTKNISWWATGPFGLVCRGGKPESRLIKRRDLGNAMRVARALEDDRLYCLEVVAWGSPKERPWAMVTLHNVYGRIPARQDYFATREEALEYYLQVIVETDLGPQRCHDQAP